MANVSIQPQPSTQASIEIPKTSRGNTGAIDSEMCINGEGQLRIDSKPQSDTNTYSKHNSLLNISRGNSNDIGSDMWFHGDGLLRTGIDSEPNPTTTDVIATPTASPLHDSISSQ